MDERIIECVPNFSDGRDLAVVASIAEAIARIPGTAILDQTSDWDHNRSVITFAGAPEGVSEAAFRGIARAAELIDMGRHRGVHPRMGAADVIPLVPVAGVTLEFCAELAARLAERVWRDLCIPVYLYEAAARLPERANLAHVRRGWLATVSGKGQQHSAFEPDAGKGTGHSTAGACVIGARRFLISFNIDLDTPELDVARKIARKIRASSGGLAAVKALGLFLESRGRAQVSTTLTDFRVTPLCAIVEAVRAEAASYGARVAGTELIGLIPRAALETAGGCDLGIQEDQILENRLDQCLR